jgi:hypothetical protein
VVVLTADFADTLDSAGSLAVVFALAEVLLGFAFAGAFLVLGTFFVVVELVFFAAEAFLEAGLDKGFFVAVALATGLAEEALVVTALVGEAFFAGAGFAFGLVAVLVLVAAGLDLALVEGFFEDLVVGIME